MKLFTKTPEVPFEALLSDMDGTLVNSEEGLEAATTLILERRGCDYGTFDKSRVVGLAGNVAMKILLEHFRIDEDPEEVVKEWRIEARRLVYSSVEPCPGVLDMLKLMEKRRIPKIVVTTSGTTYSERVMQITKLRKRFLGLITKDVMSDLGMRTKPAPDPYLHAAGVLDVKPENCLVLEDSAVGTMAGKQAGCYVIAISHGDVRIAQKLRVAGADQVVKTLEEFPEALAAVKK